ncbi:hypothetical protein EC2729250_4994 [Escherichia coli 2729250]|nr:hypothetical protein EC2770900_5048 [Escherichia coli 2770900]EMW63564.1 hypothetical protein EC2749250_5051 [Escherichia coli 2749250]EMW69801.1 hypothetical protein EC2747800_4833 [Escherichia coli 2747800]EMX04365.1 hypothetical protein ECP03023081_4987 [Escherichia coli P0302308.1]EMX79225.1 hypothetical protein ECENVIRA101_5407 [Escherichia coli Envira 10/1]EMZ85674.1 hypothetical protein ECP03052931_1855 [Escherichia coli p0305293.1]ENA46182.1 hypothetical protein EC2729250_4994 [Esc
MVTLKAHILPPPICSRQAAVVQVATNKNNQVAMIQCTPFSHSSPA